MNAVPINDVPSQSLNVTLGGQACRIVIYTRSTGLYADVYVNDEVVVAGSLCVNAVPIVRDAYLGLAGDLFFYDTQGVTDPATPGLGSRYILMYLEAAELAEIES
jgi:hypothetical protein